MKAIIGKLIALAYSSSEAISEAASTGSSIFISLKDTKIATSSNYIVACTMAATTGLIHWVTNYFFQGTVIKERFSKNHHPEESQKLLLIQDQQIPLRKKLAYIGSKYGYVTFASMVYFLEIYLLYSATKAWINDLSEGEDIPLSEISGYEELCILLYYLNNLLFVATNEFSQTIKQITERFHFPEGKRPDEKFITFLRNIVKPIARSPRFRQYVRMSGTGCDTLEHMTPLLIIFPPSWVLWVIKQPALYRGGIISIFALGDLIIAATILGQTYYFEGNYTKNTLLEIAYGGDEIFDEIMLEEEQNRWVRPTVAHIAHKFLYLPGFVHGADASLSVSLAFREMGFHPVLSYSAGGAIFAASWLGNHFSEVKESQEELKKITNEPLAKLLMGSKSSLLFKYHRDREYQSSSKALINEDERYSLASPL